MCFFFFFESRKVFDSMGFGEKERKKERKRHSEDFFWVLTVCFSVGRTVLSPLTLTPLK